MLKVVVNNARFVLGEKCEMSKRKVQQWCLDEILTFHTGGMPGYISSSSSSSSLRALSG